MHHMTLNNEEKTVAMMRAMASRNDLRLHYSNELTPRQLRLRDRSLPAKKQG